MEKRYILKVATDGRVEREEFDAADSLGQLQRAVGGHIERIHVPMVKGHDLFVDEEGLIARKPVNQTLTKFWQRRTRSVAGLIVGNGVFAAHDGNGETVGLTEDECADIERTLARCGGTVTDGKAEEGGNRWK